jgi:drug/metabolite transporter (DMT)-like permease
MSRQCLGGENPKPLWMLVAASSASLLAISSAATLIRLTDAPALAIAAYRMMISAGILWVFYPFTRTNLRKIQWRPILLAGIFLALHFALWISSLDSTSVASSLVLVTMNPVIVALGSTFILKEKPSRQVIVGTVVSIIGCLVLIMGEGQISYHSWKGNLLALGGAIAMSCYMLTGRKARSSVDLYSYITFLYSVSGVILILVCQAGNVALTGFTGKTYVFLFLIAVIPQIVGHSLINWVLKYLHTSYLAAVILLEPLLGSLIAYWILREGVSSFTLIGGTLILSGVAGVFLKRGSVSTG